MTDRKEGHPLRHWTPEPMPDRRAPAAKLAAELDRLAQRAEDLARELRAVSAALAQV